MKKIFGEGGVQRKNGIAIKQVLLKREGDILQRKDFGVGETWLQIPTLLFL